MFLTTALAWLFNAAAVSGIMFGGVLPYVAQYRAMAHNRSGAGLGFSLYVPLILLLSNLTRLYFWFCVHYELPLLVQSIVMILAQLVLLRRCVEHPDRDATSVVSIRGLRWQEFWQWTAFEDYVLFLVLYSGVLSLLTALLSGDAVFQESLGYAALLTEACLGLPQAWSNMKRRSTKGMSPWMVAGWAAGDAFKVLYAVIRKVPVQFFVCALLQLLVDGVVFGQILRYGSAEPTSGPHRAKPILDVLDALSALRLPSPQFDDSTPRASPQSDMATRRHSDGEVDAALDAFAGLDLEGSVEDSGPEASPSEHRSLLWRSKK